MSPQQKKAFGLTAYRSYIAVLVTAITITSGMTLFWVRAFVSRTNQDHDNITNIQPRLNNVERTVQLTDVQLQQIHEQLSVHDQRIGLLMNVTHINN